jgi:hypothetical protein
VLRWLAPVVTVIALVVQSASVFAAAGVKNDIMCCCPSIDVCKCHEHDGPPLPTHMNRCGGAVHEDAPVMVQVTLPEPPAPLVADVVTHVAIVSVEPTPATRTYVPEKPPF